MKLLNINEKGLKTMFSKKTILIAISLLACMFVLSGCGTETAKNETVQNSDNMTPIGNETSANATGQTGNATAEDNRALIEQLMKEKGLADEEETTHEEEETNETADNRALIEQLMKEKGLIDNETDNGTNATEEEPESETPTNFTIEIIHMRGEPEKDLDIKAGSSVTWISRQPNYVHRIQIKIKSDTGIFKEDVLDDPVGLLENESFAYTFDDAGIYKWMSLTNYPTTSGVITVTE